MAVWKKVITSGSAASVKSLTVATDLTVGDDLTLNTDNAVLNMGDGNDVTLTHDGTTGGTLAGTPISINSTSCIDGLKFLKSLRKSISPSSNISWSISSHASSFPVSPPIQPPQSSTSAVPPKTPLQSSGCKEQLIQKMILIISIYLI